MYPVNMPELDQYGADAPSIGPLLAQCWHITACLNGIFENVFLFFGIPFMIL